MTIKKTTNTGKNQKFGREVPEESAEATKIISFSLNT